MSRLQQFLSGVRVVDLSRHLPGPLASQMMADMGASVTKVEPPQGEEMRFIGPQGTAQRSAYFDAVNAGKQGVKLNLKSPDDLSRLHALLADADVLLESFRPDVMAKLGLAIETLRSRYPRLIIVSLNGYGANSPLNKAVGHDLNYLAMNGLLQGTGTPDQAVAPWPPLADCTASLFGLSSLLAALYERERSGQGCHIEVALADSVMPLQVFALAELSVQGAATPRAEGLLNGGAARYRTYRTADDAQIALGAVEPKFWQAFCHAAERPDWIVRADDPLPQNDLQQELTDYFASLTLAQCEQQFADVECCYNQLLDLSEAVTTPHIQARKLVVQQDGIWQALYPAYVDGAPVTPRQPFQSVSLPGDPSSATATHSTHNKDD